MTLQFTINTPDLYDKMLKDLIHETSCTLCINQGLGDDPPHGREPSRGQCDQIALFAVKLCIDKAC